MAVERWRNRPDASEDRGAKFERACEIVERHYADRWPIRGKVDSRTAEYRPFDDVLREGVEVEYKKRPNAKG